MEGPPDFWAGVVFAVGVLIAVVGTIQWAIRRREENRIAQQSLDLAKEQIATARKVNEADTVPQISIDSYRATVIPGYGTIRESEVHHALRPPSPWVKPIPMLVTTVKDEGKIRVSLSKAGIRLERTGQQMELPSDHGANVAHAFSFPFVLPDRESFQVNVEPILIKRMLGVLQAQPDDEFTVWVAERIGQQYFSEPMKVSDFLADSKSFNVAVGFEPQITVEGREEEYFPEGLQLPEPSDDPPDEEAKN